MVEGHSVHRVATRHRQLLIGHKFHATSPNGRFTAGAAAIHGKVFYRIEAVGKNLFAFFRNDTKQQQHDETTVKKRETITHDNNNNHDDEENNDPSTVVVRVHFGMAGNWAVYEHHDKKNDAVPPPPPPPTPTNRLRLQNTTIGVTADLSAMSVEYGNYQQMYLDKRATLGQDPLREDANPALLWEKIQKNKKKSIGALLMDQSYFTGPGNIYRAEILFKAGVHPDVLGCDLRRSEFDTVWYHTVNLLQRGYQTGSILTVDKDDPTLLPGNAKLRRYIYNRPHCPRCATRIQTWIIASRTCYACPTCQPKRKQQSPNDDDADGDTEKEKGKATSVDTKPCIPFNSHCARESAQARLQESGPERLTVAELKSILLTEWGFPSSLIPKVIRKAGLVELFKEMQKQRLEEEKEQQQQEIKPLPQATTTTTTTPTTSNADTITTITPGIAHIQDVVSSQAAAAEKARANESLAVEHVAELAPGQARRARQQRGDAEAPTSAMNMTATPATPPPRRGVKRPTQKAAPLAAPTAVTPSPKKQRRRTSPRGKQKAT